MSEARHASERLCGCMPVMRHKVCVWWWLWWWDRETSKLWRCAGSSLYVKHMLADINLKWQHGDAQHRLRSDTHTHTHSIRLRLYRSSCFPFSLLMTHTPSVTITPTSSLSLIQIHCLISLIHPILLMWQRWLCLCGMSNGWLMTGRRHSEPRQQALLLTVQTRWQNNIITRHSACVNTGTNRLRQPVSHHHKTNSRLNVSLRITQMVCNVLPGKTIDWIEKDIIVITGPSLTRVGCTVFILNVI